MKTSFREFALTFSAILTAICLVSPAYAGKKNDKNMSEAKKRRLERKAEREKAYLAAEAFMKSKDANGDGSLNREEFLLTADDKEAAGVIFDEANKNGDRCLTISEIAAAGLTVKKK